MASSTKSVVGCWRTTTNNRSHDTTSTAFDEMSDDESSIIKHALYNIGVDVLEPTTRQEESLAEALAEFASFVLMDEQEACRAIVDRHMELSALQENASSSCNPNIGELQGGSDEFDIYRLSIPHHHHGDDHGENHSIDEDDDDDENAAVDLLQAFHTSRQGKEYRNILTFDTLQQYMLDMCEKRSNQRRRQRYDEDDDDECGRQYTYTQLGNVMLILAFGPTQGQPRHIDHMHPNLPVFLYMSENCPSTIIYDTTTSTSTRSTAHHHHEESEQHAATTTTEPPPTIGIGITNTRQILQYWQQECSVAVPTLLQTLLKENAHTKLRDPSSPWWPHTQYFAFWYTIDTMLQHFGKLYQSVSSSACRPLALTATRPGTTMLVGGGGSNNNGNHVHAGPPTRGPRLFAFAVGIPEESIGQDDDDDDSDCRNRSINNDTNGSSSNKEEMADGEVQYNPVLFHADLCCILFTLMDFHYNECCSYQPTPQQELGDDKEQSKRFLIHDILIPLVKGLMDCNDRIDYERLLGDERQELRDWLQRLTSVFLEHGESEVQMNGLVQEALESKCIFYSPDVVLTSRNSKKKTRRKDHRRQKKKQANGNMTSPHKNYR